MTHFGIWLPAYWMKALSSRAKRQPQFNFTSCTKMVQIFEHAEQKNQVCVYSELRANAKMSGNFQGTKLRNDMRATWVGS
jgi:hypothetical protein